MGGDSGITACERIDPAMVVLYFGVAQVARLFLARLVGLFRLGLYRIRRIFQENDDAVLAAVLDRQCDYVFLVPRAARYPFRSSDGRVDHGDHRAFKERDCVSRRFGLNQSSSRVNSPVSVSRIAIMGGLARWTAPGLMTRVLPI